MKRSLFAFIVFALAGCAAGPDGSPWIPLIDGAAGMENFNRVGNANWQVKDGSVYADRSEKGAGFLVTKKTYGDFMIRVEFWASHDANSGIFMRCQDPAVITDKSCYEANIFDQRPDPSYGTGGIVHFAAIQPPMVQAGGQWNVFEITARGSRVTVLLNGKQTVDMVHSQFAKGPIALQWGRGVVRFRKVQIQEL